MGIIISTIENSLILETLVKLVLVFILSGIIGLERESWSKPAGFRTHVLVGISAVLVVLCGEYIAEKNGKVDPTRIPAQLLSGIGFLGAGTILRDGLSIKGLTTAASLLSVTCIGMSIGAGFYVGGILATIIVFCVLSYFKSISDKIERRSDIKVKIKVKQAKENIKEIKKILDLYNVETSSIKIIDEENLEYEGKCLEEINKNKIFYKLMELSDVYEVIEKKETAEN